MARHSTTGLHSSSLMAPSTYTPTRLVDDLIILNASPDSYRHELATCRSGGIFAAPRHPIQQQLPSFKELMRSVEYNVKDSSAFNDPYHSQMQRCESVQSLRPERWQSLTPEVQPKASSCAASTADSFDHCNADGGHSDRQYVPDNPFEDSTGTKVTWFDRAKMARETIHRHFGHESASTLQQIRLEVDPNRPAFSSDSKLTQRPATVTKNSKHGEAERDRRAVHAIALTQQAKRFPNAIFELTTYETGNRKAPGKHHIFVAALLMYEFDTLLVGKQQEEIARLRRQQREQKREPTTSLSRHHQPSCDDEDSSSAESPRKRKRYDELTDAAPCNSRRLPYRDDNRSHGSRHYHSNSDSAHCCDIGDQGMLQDGFHPRKAPRYYRHQPPLPLSPAPTSGGFSARDDSPSSAP